MNKAILIGRLTAEPELKKTQSGNSVVSFQIAVDRRFKGQDGQRQADFITIQAWRQTAEFIAQYFHKGDPIGIEGPIQTRSYEDKHGNKRTAVEVVADQAFFLPGAKKKEPPTAEGTSSDGFEEVQDDDLPFNFR